jgi:hypothetical protein
VDVSRPIETIPSEHYERGGKCQFPVIGQICWVWDVAVPRGKPKVFEVNNGSILIELREAETLRRLARWSVEIGAIDSPGCYFHSHPESLICVPRLPSLFVTPMDALEFLIGELFQEKWDQAVVAQSGHWIYARTRQTLLLAQVLEWKRQRVSSTVGSPWVALKGAKPENKEALFVE